MANVRISEKDCPRSWPTHNDTSTNYLFCNRIFLNSPQQNLTSTDTKCRWNHNRFRQTNYPLAQAWTKSPLLAIPGPFPLQSPACFSKYHQVWAALWACKPRTIKAVSSSRWPQRLWPQQCCSQSCPSYQNILRFDVISTMSLLAVACVVNN